MNQKSIKIFILTFFCGLIIYLGISVFVSFSKLSPQLNGIFEIGNNIENNQRLIDSSFILVNLNTRERFEIKFEKDKEVTLYFISTKGKTYINDINVLGKNTDRFNNLYLIVNDSSDQVKKNIKKVNNRLSIYFCDTIGLPFKYKKLIYPYTIQIIGDSIRSSFIGNINRIDK